MRHKYNQGRFDLFLRAKLDDMAHATDPARDAAALYSKHWGTSAEPAPFVVAAPGRCAHCPGRHPPAVADAFRCCATVVFAGFWLRFLLCLLFVNTASVNLIGEHTDYRCVVCCMSCVRTVVVGAHPEVVVVHINLSAAGL